MYQIFHNPRCKKSREALDFLEIKSVEHEVILYLKNNLSKEQIKNLVNQLKIHPKNLIRIQEKVWKENFKNKVLSVDQYYEILINHPILLERPIVTFSNTGIIAKPIDKLANFIKKN
jgi:arsenate reductase|tara:strand:+ start:1554 stop:1904 length:351 start_codon:yes stop_codon:yes gene_type:complete